MRLGDLFKDNSEARAALKEFCKEQIDGAHRTLEIASGDDVLRAQCLVSVVREFQRKVKSVIDEGERDARRRQG